MKRLFIFSLILFFVFLLAPMQPANAQSWKMPSGESFGGAIQGEDVNAQSSWHTGIQYSMYSMSCLGAGLNCTDQLGDAGSYIRNSAVGKLSDVVAMTFINKPADFGLWLADTGQTLGFIPKQAYAQGIGFSGLMPLLPIWKAFRNIAYLLMAVVMMVLGFMIMFRKKIDPKTVVTAQNAIPRVIIALILITFSYAIVGLLIDAMNIVLFFVIALFKSTGLLDDPGQLASSLFQYKTPEALYGQGGLMANFFNLQWNPYQILFGVNAVDPLKISVMSIAVAAAGLAVGALGNPILGGAFFIGGLGMPVIHLFLTVALIFLFIRLVAFFLGAYIQVIISLIFAPIQLLFESIPGSNAFSSWAKNLVSNLAVFPVAAIMFMLSAVFTHFANDAVTPNRIWAPPYVGLANNMTSISALVSLGILFAIPQVAGSIKEALKAKPVAPMFDFGGAGGSTMQWLSSAYYIRSFIPQEIINRVFPKKEGH